MRRSGFLAKAVAVLLLIGLPLLLACSTEPELPNVVVIMVDALRYDHLGTYGHLEDTSPFLDRLASDSIVFENAYAHCPQTICSTASFFTSLYFPTVLILELSSEEKAEYAQHQSVQRRGTLNVLVTRGQSFPELLTERGYHTTAFLTNPHHHENSGFPDLFDEPHLYLKKNLQELGLRDTEVPYLRADKLGQVYLDWLEQFDDAERPFMAYVHFMDPHNPYRPPTEFADQFVETEGRDLYSNGPPKTEPTKADIEYMKELYDAEVAFTDAWIERIVETTKQQSSRPTIFVITADHGDEFMEHGGFGHGKTLEKEMLRVPLIMHGFEHESTRVPHLVRHVDIGPTLLRSVGARLPMGRIDGHDLFATPAEADGAVSRGARQSVASSGKWLSLTTPEWHYIAHRDNGTFRLYEAQSDPAGLVDLFEERTEVVEQLDPILRAVREYRFDRARYNSSIKAEYEQQGLLSRPSDEVIEQLQSLGYLQ